MKVLPLFVSLVLASSSGFGQTKPEPQTQQQILDELRAIHRDIRANSTTQLLLAEMQLTQTTVDRATQRRDALRSEVVRLQADEKTTQAEIARTEESLGKTMDAAQKAQLTDRLDHLKEGFTRITTVEHGESDQLLDADGRVRTAQANLDSIESQLSELVRKLGPVN